MRVHINNKDLNNDDKYNFNYSTRRRLSKGIARKMKETKRNGKISLIEDGDKVKINYNRIINRDDYQKDDVINEKYKEFVENNKDTVFTVTSETIGENNMRLFSFEESEVKWLFHPIDLIKIENNEKDD